MRPRKATQEQLTALRSALGAYSTVNGTTNHALFEGMHSRGWVREVAPTSDGTMWQLSSGGLDLAYPNKVPFARRCSFG